MEYLKSIIIPLLVIVVFYLLLLFAKNKKLFNLEIFIKIRILIGCIGVGVFLCLAFQEHALSKILNLTILACILFYGVVSLMNKYLNLKD